MDIKGLDKKQLILLTLLITFVVSIATGIITVSLMNQMPDDVPQTINNVIQRTIEKVTTVQVPAPKTVDNDSANSKDNLLSLFSENKDALVFIYSKDMKVGTEEIPIVSDTSVDNTVANPNDNTTNLTNDETSSNLPTAIGQGVIISEVGLILVDSNIIKEQESYKVILNKIDFDVSVLKKFDNGFTILKISSMTDEKEENTSDKTNKTE